MESLSDALLAQLMGMGFEQEDIIACQVSLKTSGSPVTLQSATEWSVIIILDLVYNSRIIIPKNVFRLLQRQSAVMNPTGHAHSDTPTLKLGTDDTTNITMATTDNSSNAQSSINRPVSTGSFFGSQTHVKSRYMYCKLPTCNYKYMYMYNYNYVRQVLKLIPVSISDSY